MGLSRVLARKALRLAGQPPGRFVFTRANHIGFDNKALGGFVSQKPFLDTGRFETSMETLKVYGLPCVGVDWAWRLFQSASGTDWRI